MVVTPGMMEGPCDAYGFSLQRRSPASETASSSDAGEEARRRCEKREKKNRKRWETEWPRPVQVASQPSPSRTSSLGDWLRWRSLKAMCREGIPPTLRGALWFEASGASGEKERATADYGSLAEAGKEATNHQIDLDLPRTFPDHPFYQTAEGRAALRRVLVAVGAYCEAEGGYCQSMNYVVAFVLLAVDRDEERAFWIMAGVVKRKVLQDTWSERLLGCRVEMEALGTLLRKRDPKVAAHLAAIGCDVSYFATDWFLCLYCKSLPSETVARVWDSFLLEGPKVLFRVALAILGSCRGEILSCGNPGDVVTVLRRAQVDLHDRCALMDQAFAVGSLPMAKIEKYRSRASVSAPE